jgi:NAD-specific glutamate dehydrogenase
MSGLEAVEKYVERHAQQIARIERVMERFENASHDDLTPLIVAIRQIRTLLA